MGATKMSANKYELALIEGDLAALNTEERLSYYLATCESLGLNPLTRPFEFIKLNGRTVLYAKKDCTDQLRKIHNISVRITSRERMDDVFIVTAQATATNGRVDESIGVVTVGQARGDVLANLLMKAETKAKRRVTLSVCGLGTLDESELETIQNRQEDRTAQLKEVIALYREKISETSTLEELNNLCPHIEQQPEPVRMALRGPFAEKRDTLTSAKKNLPSSAGDGIYVS